MHLRSYIKKKLKDFENNGELQQISVVDKNTAISNGSSMDFELMQEIFQNIESLAHRLSNVSVRTKFQLLF